MNFIKSVLEIIEQLKSKNMITEEEYEKILRAIRKDNAKQLSDLVTAIVLMAFFNISNESCASLSSLRNLAFSFAR